MMTVTSFNHWPQVANNLHNGLKRTVKSVATTLQKDAKTLTPVDTGFLRDSIYTSGTWGSNYGEATAHTAVSKKRKSQYKTQAYLTRDLLPEVTPSGDDLTAYVACAAEYGIYVNYGTYKMAAQPFWEPALDIAKVNLDGQLAVLAASLGASVSGSIEDIST